MTQKQLKILPPLLVCLGAFLWATDSLFRHHLTATLSPIFIVTVSHLMTLIITLPIAYSKRRVLKIITKKEGAILLFLSLGSSVSAMIFFTKAFAITSNYNVPILLQKLQPIIAIFLASKLLKETLTIRFLLFSAMAIFGAYLVSFGDLGIALDIFSDLSKSSEQNSSDRNTTILFSLAACTIWGTGTVAAKYFLTRHDFISLTSFRYVIATITLVILSFSTGQFGALQGLTIEQLKNFFIMAFIPGLLALFIYYKGLKNTPASVATLCELSFPFGAIYINWYFLNSSLNFLQVLGSLLLIGSITVINIYDKKIKL